MPEADVQHHRIKRGDTMKPTSPSSFMNTLIALSKHSGSKQYPKTLVTRDASMPPFDIRLSKK